MSLNGGSASGLGGQGDSPIASDRKVDSKLLSPAITTTPKSAEIPLGDLCHSTIHSLVHIPGVLAEIVNGAKYRLVAKVGAEFQTGLGAVNRQSKHNTDVSYNTTFVPLCFGETGDPVWEKIIWKVFTFTYKETC